MIQSEYLSDLRHKAREIRNESQKSFYFLEAEELLRRPTPSKWSIVEVFAHIGIVQAFYLKNITRGLDRAPELTHDQTEFSWLGRKLIDYTEPKDGIIRMKMRTFKKTDPIHRAKKGIVVNEKIVFQDFVSDIEEMEELIIKAYDKELTAVKIPTFLPFLKINLADALGFSIAHTERHIEQARKIIGN